MPNNYRQNCSSDSYNTLYSYNAKPLGTVQGPKAFMYVHKDDYSTYGNGLSLGCGDGSCMQLDYADSAFAFKTQRFNQCNNSVAPLPSCGGVNYNTLTHSYVDPKTGENVQAEGANGFFTYDSAYGPDCGKLVVNSQGRTILPKDTKCGQQCGYYTPLTACNPDLNNSFQGSCGNNMK